MTEYDAEALQLGERPGLVVIGKESRTENGTPILPYVTTAPYLWLETMGGSYHIAPNGTQRNGAGVVSVTLA